LHRTGVVFKPRTCLSGFFGQVHLVVRISLWPPFRVNLGSRKYIASSGQYVHTVRFISSDFLNACQFVLGSLPDMHINREDPISE